MDLRRGLTSVPGSGPRLLPRGSRSAPTSASCRRPAPRLPCDFVPDAREIEPADADRICAAMTGVRDARDELEKAVAQALLNGASVRAVAELGLSPNTVQKYGRAHGWPTEENRRRFNESRWDRQDRERSVE